MILVIISNWVDNIDETCCFDRVFGHVVVIGCLDRLFVQVWCIVDALVHGTGFVQVWCMVDALVHGTGFVQVGARLMHLFMVHVE